jgi:hypothetical protein
MAKNIVNQLPTESLMDVLLVNPYVWLATAVISGVFLYFKYFNPKKIEWIEALCSLLFDFSIYLITFQWMRDNKNSSDKFITVIIVFSMIFFGYKIISLFI